MKKFLLVALAAAGFTAAFTPAIASNGYDIWATQSRAETPSASGGQTSGGENRTLTQLLEPNGPFAQ